MNAPSRNTLDSQVLSFDTTKTGLIAQQQAFFTWVNAQPIQYLTNGITCLEILAGGSGYIDTSTTCAIYVPTGQPNAPSQTQAVAVLSFGISSVTINAGGTGYSVGNVLAVAGGTGGTVTVATLSGSAVLTVTVTTPGYGYLTHTGSTTTGAGTGCTLNITSLTIAGSGNILNMVMSTGIGSGYGSTIAPSTANGLIVVADSGGGTGASLMGALSNSDNPLNYTLGGAVLLQTIAQAMQNDSLATQGLLQSGAGIGTIILHSGGGGSGYAANNVLTIVQAGGIGGTMTVLTVSGGAILTVSLTTPGFGYALGTSLAVTGGAGTGATFDITALEGVTAAGVGFNFMSSLITGSGLGV